ncbi:putative protein N(5)-glutamine methyltransferase [Streptomyces sp. NPDC047315]|uniref:putative protein N(5)-glutamine methyltransferase n=1 Tax=Streptomyces sp. NPDC047315 TaxID=3155142 RepID=UPI0034093D62
MSYVPLPLDPSDASVPSASSAPSASSFEVVVARLRAAGCVFAEEEARLLLAAADRRSDRPAALAALVERRVAGLPLEHVLGWAEFCGLRVEVDPGVFVPRRRTEFLVRHALVAARPGAVVVDLCCGSGALGAAVAAGVARRAGAGGGVGAGVGAGAGAGGGVELHAADIDPASVRCARRNVAGFDGRAYGGDLYAALPDRLRGTVDVLLANVPYVPTDEIDFLPAEARVYEARVALDGGRDGLDVLRRVAAGARSWLAPGGSLLFETGQRQTAAAVEAVVRGGLTARVETSDEWAATVVIGGRPGSGREHQPYRPGPSRPPRPSGPGPA